MDTEKNWFKSNRWVLPMAIGIVAFAGMFLQLVAVHPVTYDPVNWAFGEESRVGLGMQLLFGGAGAIVWPYWVLFGLIFIAVILLPLGKAMNKTGTFASISMFLFLIAGVLFLLSSFFYGFVNGLATAGSYKDSFVDPSNPSAYSDNYYWYLKTYVATADGRLGVGAILSGVLSILACLTCLSFSLDNERFSIRDMTEIAMLSASAIVLDVIFHFLPNIPGQVGSMSLALLPLYVIALRHGPARGFLAATLIYGLITCFLDGYGLWLYPLDYFVAFSGVAIIGFFSKYILDKEKTTYNLRGILLIILGVMLSGVVRFFGSVSSSIVNYGYEFAPAAVVNLYAFISAAMCALALCLLYGPLLRLNRRFPVRKENGFSEQK